VLVVWRHPKARHRTNREELSAFTKLEFHEPPRLTPPQKASSVSGSIQWITESTKQNSANRVAHYFRFFNFSIITPDAIIDKQTKTQVSQTARIPGKVVRQRSYSAFVPDPLPPKFDWNSKLVRSLSEADRLIGKLAGEGRRLPNPHLLIRPFARAEAVLSSKIEGTQATLGELLAAEAGIAVDRSPDDLREVANYVIALEHGIKRLQKLPICVRLIKELHEKLMTGVRGHHSSRGEFRTVQNWIGKPGCTPEAATFVPPPPDQVEPCLAEWENFVNTSDLPPLVTIALAHYQFEAIHPFLDGNGRVGRLLISLFLVEQQILPAPLLYLSAFFEASRREYYDSLRAISERGAWEDWIEYFLLGVARMSQDVLNRARRINTTIAEWQTAVAGDSTNTTLRVLELLAANPFITANGIVEKLNVAFTTAQRAIARLERHGVIQQTTDARRDRVYCAKALLAILEEPAQLTPQMNG
jgi:Fic family protein